MNVLSEEHCEKLGDNYIGEKFPEIIAVFLGLLNKILALGVEEQVNGQKDFLVRE